MFPKPKKPTGKIDTSGFAFPKTLKKPAKKSDEGEVPHPKPRRVRSQATIDKCRKPLCEVCGKSAHGEPHHVIPRSVARCDHPYNLVQLCGDCHYVKVANGELTKEQLFPIIAKREKKPVEEIRKAVAEMIGRPWI